MPILKRIRKKEYEPQASLGYTTRYLKKTQINNIGKKRTTLGAIFFKREDKPDVVFMSAIPEAETGGSL